MGKTVATEADLASEEANPLCCKGTACDDCLARFVACNFPITRRRSVNRSELVESVELATGLDRRQSEGAVKAVVDAVIAEIKSGTKVSIFGFGTFTPTSRAARVGRNPQTGAAVNIAASTGVKFSPATALKALLNPKPPAKKASASAKKASASAKKASAPASGSGSGSGKKAAASEKAAPAKKSAKSSKKK
jgi:DNA-binding protein HU-beta